MQAASDVNTVMRRADLVIGMPLGIIVTNVGITGDAGELSRAHKIVSDVLKERRRLIMITVGELQELADTAEFVLLLKRKILALVVRGGLQ